MAPSVTPEATVDEVIAAWVSRRVNRCVQVNAYCVTGFNGYGVNHRFEVACLEPGKICYACGQPMLKTKPKCRNHSSIESWHPTHIGYARTLAEACAQALASIRNEPWPYPRTEDAA